ncbi:MAG: hypothetical protein N2643_01750 [Endomicrobia bacterium]|nr:hypothetical protein [Endomicrobiia bacterium]
MLLDENLYAIPVGVFFLDSSVTIFFIFITSEIGTVAILILNSTSSSGEVSELNLG